MHTIKNIKSSFSIVLFCLILSVSMINATEFPSKHEIDSIKSLINNCNTDTCSFAVLQNIFWHYRFTGNKYSEFYGEWAFQVIKNSKDARALSNGYDIKANMLLREGKTDSAYYYLSKALEISKKIDFKFRMAWSYFGLGEIINIHYKKPLQSTGYYKEAIKNFTNINNIDNLIYANSSLALIYQYQNKFDSALFYYNENTRLYKENPHKESEIYNYINIYYLYKNANDGKKAVENLYAALTKAETLKDEMVLSHVYKEVGLFCFEQKRYSDMALNYYDKALLLAENNNWTDVKAAIYNLIGKVYFEEKENRSALEYYAKGLNASKKIDNKCIMSDSYLNLGNIYKELGKDELAIESFTLSFQNSPTLCSHNALIEIAEIYLKNKKYDRSLSWYNKSLQIAETSNSEYHISKSKFSLGKYYYQINDLKKAESLYLESFSLAQELKNIRLLKDISDALSSFYITKKNYQEAVVYLQTSMLMADSLFCIEKKSGITTLENRFEFEKIKNESDRKEAIATENLKKQKIYLYFSLSITILISILGLVIFSSYRRKKKDNKLLKIQKEEIEKISTQLHESDEMKLQFFANISHEFRTPLTLIISPLVRFLNNNKIENPEKLFNVMLRNARKLQSLTNQVLDISKLDKGELTLNANTYNFNKLVRISVANFESAAEDKDINFQVIEHDLNLIFKFDSERLEQVLNNVLSNAIKFTNEGGFIILELSSFDRSAELRVRNTGLGIPDEDLNKVFTRFYRSKNAVKSNIEGSGIGLAFAKQLVEMHNGNITVQNLPGGWTEFIIKLPVNEGYEENIIDNQEENFIISNILEEEVGYASKKLPVILLVEDNKDLRQYLTESLSESYKVLTATNGNEGISIASKILPDVIISDIMMPETDGFQLTSVLKENIKTCHIPILLLTAKANRDSKIKGLELGADDYIIKPFDEQELLLKIRNIFDNRKKLQEKFRKQIIANPSEIETTSMDEKFLLKLTNIIEQDIANPGLDTDYICLKIGLSKSQLYRKLKALTDLSLSQFVRSVRLKRAAQLLLKKSATVSEIAYMTGFESLSYFTTRFKEEFGKLPSEY